MGLIQSIDPFLFYKLSSFCEQLKLYADDGKKYLSDVINESGARLLLTIIPKIFQLDVGKIFIFIN